ncbi:acyltransferase family protein [Pseudomonas iridis]|uniref:Acyltransferase family protein n=1 Tax=Pseudomonas iridis TaxID=2710587 RepID=A0ABW8DLK5_9PSED
MKYRPEIDGLRAISVTAVLLFHLGASLFPGGFVGVDIFFVISGFLITSIIKKEIEAGSFSIMSFYDRRIRRIFPALLAMIGCTIVFGYFALLPGEYQKLGISSAYSVASISNFFFFNNTGYFDAAAKTMPLLHTWSLAVEEQFYLGLPLLLLILFAVSRKRASIPIIGTALVMVSSFAWSIYVIQTDPKAAFFLPQYRVWELGIGALLAFLPSNAKEFLPRWALEAAPIVGLTMIFYGVFMFNEKEPFPGFKALIPATGAALVLFQSGAMTFANRLLRFQPLPKIGLISYSLYLWHWPIIVFWQTYTGNRELGTGEMLGIAGFSLAAAWMSWAFIEQPFRKLRGRHSATIAYGLIAALVVGVAGFSVNKLDGFPARISSEAIAITSKDKMWDYTCPQTLISGPAQGLCAVGADWSTAKSHGVIWGDSHAEHFLPLLDGVAKKAGVSIVLYRGCSPFLGSETVQGYFPLDPTLNNYCRDRREKAVTLINSIPDLNMVILASAWSGYPMRLFTPKEGSSLVAKALTKPVFNAETNTHGQPLLKEALSTLTEEIDKVGRRIILIGDFPNMTSDPIACALSNERSLVRRNCTDRVRYIPKSEFEYRQSQTMSTLRSLKSENPKVDVLIPGDYLCGDKGCTTSIDGVFFYRDTDHIRRNMSEEENQKLAHEIHLPEIITPSGFN